MITRIVCLVIGYLFGLIQTSYFIGRINGFDIRTKGSGNAGTTNTMRVLGKKAAIINLLMDIVKCILAVTLVSVIFSDTCYDILPLLKIYTAAGCVLGHNFPFYLNFRGGKGIACSVGMLIVFDMRIFWMAFVLFFLLFFTTHYVSLCSISCYVLFLISSVVFGQMGSYGMEQAALLEMYVVILLLTCMAIYRHRANIKRLLSGTENKIFLSHKK